MEEFHKKCTKLILEASGYWQQICAQQYLQPYFILSIGFCRKAFKAKRNEEKYRHFILEFNLYRIYIHM